MMLLADRSVEACWCGAARTENADGTPSVLCPDHLGVATQHDDHDRERGMEIPDLSGVLVTWTLSG